MYHLARLTGRSVFSKKVVADFWDVHFPCLTVGGNVDSYMNSFSSIYSLNRDPSVSPTAKLQDLILQSSILKMTYLKRWQKN